MTETRLFTWIHLADLHARPTGAVQPSDNTVLLDALRVDIESQLRQSGATADAIFVAGDIAFTGDTRSGGEYEIAQDWLAKLGAAASVEAQSIFVVPGNHDVQRDVDRNRGVTRLLTLLRKGEDSIDTALADPGDRALLERRFENYLHFSARFAPACFRKPPSLDLFWHHRIQARSDLKIRLVGLNTALLSADNNDQGNLRAGITQFTRAFAEPLVEDAELVIALGHHPFQDGWLADQRELEAIARGRIHIYLSGSVGNPSDEFVRLSPGGFEARVKAGGYASANDPATEYRYNIGSVIARSDGALIYRLYPRRWFSDRASFAPDGAQLSDDHLAIDLILAGVRLARTGPTSASGSPTRSSEDHHTISPARSVFEGPGQRPALPVPHFEGRRNELAAISHHFSDPRVVCIVVSGLAGIGKTALVRQYVATSARERFPDGVAWLDGRNLAHEVGRLARRFGWNSTPAEATTALEWILQELQEKAALLVIDDCDMQGETLRLLPLVGGRCRTIITSRNVKLRHELPVHASSIHLSSLDHSSAIALLRESTSPLANGTDEDLDRLVDMVGGLPLALALVGRLLTSPGTTVANLRTRLERDLLRPLESAATGLSSGIESTFKSVIASLPEDRHRVLIALGTCAPNTRVAAVAKVSGVGEEDVTSALLDLAERSIAMSTMDPERPWSLHPLFRAVARTDALSPSLAKVHLSWVQEHITEHLEPIDWQDLDQEIPEILTAIERLLDEEEIDHATQLLRAILGHMYRRGRFVDIEPLLQKAIPLALAQNRLFVLVALADIHERTGKLSIARDELRQASTVADTNVDPDLDTYLQVLRSEDVCDAGDLAGAIAYKRNHLSMLQQRGSDEMLANAHLSIGVHLLFQNRTDEASIHLHEAHQIAQVSGDIPVQASTFDALGTLYVRRGDIKSAVQYLNEALTCSIRSGSRLAEGHALGGLGTCYLSVGIADRALGFLQQSLLIFEEIGDVWGQAIQLANLGDWNLSLGNLTEATSYFAKALAIYRHMNIPDTHFRVVPLLKVLQEQRPLAGDKLTSSAYITRMALSSVRSVDSLEWSCEADRCPGWHVIIGNNGSGKSSVLRAIALALLGKSDALALRQDWSDWIRRGAEHASVSVSLLCYEERPTGSGNLPPLVLWDTGLEFSAGSSKAGPQLTDLSYWIPGVRTWFSAAFGPFRRFTGGDLEYTREFDNNPRVARHLSVFDERVALSESLAWLKGLRAKSYEGHPDAALLEPLIAFINQEGFLPHGAQLREVTFSAVSFVDGNGVDVLVDAMSDGYRSAFSLTLELIRQFAAAYGSNEVFTISADEIVVSKRGIVLVDEVDAHLHPTWQQTIGTWLKHRFPLVQFIVSTHSPLVCQAADTVFLLPLPGTDDDGRMLSGAELDRIRYGNVLDAYGTNVFGVGVGQSEEGKRKGEQLAALNARELFNGPLAEAERAMRDELRAALPTKAAALPDAALEALVDRLKARTGG